MSIEAIKPVEKSRDWELPLQVEQLRNQAAYQALQIFASTVSGKMGSVLKKEKSEMLILVLQMQKSPEKFEDISVRLGQIVEEGKTRKDTYIYSVKLGVENDTKILTLRVGPFTELSYEKNGGFVEIATQKGNEIKFEKFA